MKAYIETYGCWLNKAESLIIKDILRKEGIEIVEGIEEANLVILNTCAVRRETEERILKRIEELVALKRRLGFKLIIVGCLANLRPFTINLKAPTSHILGPQALERIGEVIKEDGRVVDAAIRPFKRSILPCYSYPSVVHIVPVATGCLGSCAFCVGPVVRGGVKSYPIGAIVKNVKDAVDKGAKIVILTAQDLAAYGRDIGTTLPELLENILSKVEGQYFLRLGMMEPSLLLKYADEMIEIYKDKRVFKYLHLPLQSGSDRILKLMNRHYTSAEYVELAMEFKRRFQELNFVTDIIVGFPGEGEEEFEETISLLRALEPDKVHVARYTPRPFTKAASMPQVPELEKKERSRVLSRIASEIAFSRNKRLVGTSRIGVIEGVGEVKTARLYNYKKVVLMSGEPKLGEIRLIKIAKATPIDLRGYI